MQFYVIHESPTINARILPDYALKKVNLREGWQMLSDIGHVFGVKFEGQNKEYNRYHPNTWRWWKSKLDFRRFCIYFLECCIEYERRFFKRNIFIDRFERFMGEGINDIISFKIPKAIKNVETESMIRYLLDRKEKYLTAKEKELLRKELGNIDENINYR